VLRCCGATHPHLSSSQSSLYLCYSSPSRILSVISVSMLLIPISDPLSHLCVYATHPHLSSSESSLCLCYSSPSLILSVISVAMLLISVLWAATPSSTGTEGDPVAIEDDSTGTNCWVQHEIRAFVPALPSSVWCRCVVVSQVTQTQLQATVSQWG
jgi:hypothetical protein